MFQREVAERIVAAPGTKTYGRLSVLAGWRTEARILFDIAAVRLHAAAEGDVVGGRADPARRARSPASAPRCERVTAAAFGQRRKMLRQSLKSLGADPLPLLAAAGIAPTERAEDIPVEGFVALARISSGAGADARSSSSQIRQQPVDEILDIVRLALALQPLGGEDARAAARRLLSRSRLTTT